MLGRTTDVDLPVGQLLHKGQIRRGKRKISQLIRPYPSAGLVANQSEGTAIPECPEGHQFDRYVIVMIHAGPETAADGGFHFQFLPKFALQALLGGLPGLDLPTGKLPQPSKPIAWVALGNQNAAIIDNDSSGDLNDGFHAVFQ